MLYFANGVACRSFRLEIALVLHHAAGWADLTGGAVDVVAIGDTDAEPAQCAAWALSVDLAMPESGPAPQRQLLGYLLRNLGAQYAVTMDGPRIHVSWDARRKCVAGTAVMEVSPETTL